MTGQCPKTGQRLIDAVTGDQSTDRHLQANIDVRVTSPLCFPEWEAGAVALASRVQAMSRNVGLPRRRRGKERRPSMSHAGSKSSFYPEDA